jgi:hypothetical protein
MIPQGIDGASICFLIIFLNATSQMLEFGSSRGSINGMVGGAEDTQTHVHVAIATPVFTGAFLVISVHIARDPGGGRLLLFSLVVAYHRCDEPHFNAALRLCLTATSLYNSKVKLQDKSFESNGLRVYE